MAANVAQIFYPGCWNEGLLSKHYDDCTDGDRPTDFIADNARAKHLSLVLFERDRKEPLRQNIWRERRGIVERCTSLCHSTKDNSERKSVSRKMRIGWPFSISASAFRCLELFSCLARCRLSWSPTIKRVVVLLTESATSHPAAAARSAASRRGMERALVNTATSP